MQNYLTTIDNCNSWFISSSHLFCTKDEQSRDVCGLMDVILSWESKSLPMCPVWLFGFVMSIRKVISALFASFPPAMKQGQSFPVGKLYKIMEGHGWDTCLFIVEFELSFYWHARLKFSSVGNMTTLISSQA